MDNIIKETLRALNLNEILSSPTIDDFVNFAVAIQAQGKRGNVGNSGQLPYFAIHLSCLKYSIETNIDLIQKKTSLDPKKYQSCLMALLKILDPVTIINPESISKYYGCPSLKNFIEEIQTKAKDRSVESSIASIYLIGQMAKLTNFGTLANLSKLWIQPVDTLRQVSNELKSHCNSEKLKASGKILTDEIKQSKHVEVAIAQKRTISPRSVSKGAKMIKTAASVDIHTSVHPLLLFNCSTNGPAFGPILY